jgi:outer membrane protein assembly factor BamB
MLRLTCLALFAFVGFTQAGDWPNWLGPNHDGHWNETGIVDKFPTPTATPKWKIEVGMGYSGPAVVGNRVFLTDFVLNTGKVTNNPNARDKIEGMERILCLDAATGKQIWKDEYKCTYNISYPTGPRCVPTVADGKVYTMGAEGDLVCLNAETGKRIWAHQLKTDYKTEAPIWGFSGHPLVDGKKLICLVGGQDSAVVAFDKDTGKEIWKALNVKDIGYCSPTIIEAAGARQLLIWHSEALVSLDPESGKTFWSEALKPNYGMSIMTPRKSGDYLYVGAIFNKGFLLKLAKDKPAAEVVWRGDREVGLYAKVGTPIVDGEYMYGVDMEGELRCVELATGKRLWSTFEPTTTNKKQNSGSAFLVKNNNRYFIFSETGNLFIAKLTPKGYEEISRTKLLEPTNPVFGRDVVWTHPAYANKCVYARNDKELICVDLAAK